MDSLIQENAQNRYRFSRWSGNGAGSYSGPERHDEIVINNPITENVVWLRECLIDIVIEPENRGTVLSDQMGTDLQAGPDLTAEESIR